MTMRRDPLAESFRAALDAEAPTDTSADDAALLSRAIEGAMAATSSVAPAPPAAASTGSLRAIGSARAARVRLLRYALPAAAVLVASVAMAAVYMGHRAPPTHDLPHSSQEAPVPAARPVAPPPAAPPAPLATDSPPSISVSDLPSATPPPSSDLSAHAAAHTAPPQTTSASELFRDANASRRAGDVDKAVELYDALVSRFAGTAEAHAARVSLGRLLLDRRGDSAGALAQFDAYLKSSSSDRALAEEARLGRALVFQRQGRQEEERRAWDELLERHPDSLYASRARERLRALASSSPSP